MTDISQIKHDLKTRKEKPQYDVMTKYKTEGIWQDMARSTYFENITLFVVVFNGIWIAVDVDWNTPETADNPIWKLMDNFFCIYFSGELVVRFGAFAHKRDIFCDGWFVFDAILVLMMVFETWAMPLYSALANQQSGGGGNAQVLRLLRLLRLSRMAKMMRSVPELMILIKGTVVGIRSVAITLALLAGITFVFAIAMRTLTDKTEVGSEAFSTVPGSAYTLLIQGVLPDNGDLMTELGNAQWYFAILFFVYIFLAALTFMNMLIGILCEAVHGVSVEEKEEMDIRHMKETMAEKIAEKDSTFDTNGEHVTRQTFFEIMKDDEVWDALGNIDVDIPSLLENAGTIFDSSPDGTLQFDDFTDVILKFRATDSSMIKVIFEVRALVYERLSTVDKKLESMTGLMKEFGESEVQAELEDIKHSLHHVNAALCDLTTPATPTYKALPAKHMAGIPERGDLPNAHAVAPAAAEQLAKAEIAQMVALASSTSEDLYRNPAAITSGPTEFAFARSVSPVARRSNAPSHSFPPTGSYVDLENAAPAAVDNSSKQQPPVEVTKTVEAPIVQCTMAPVAATAAKTSVQFAEARQPPSEAVRQTLWEVVPDARDMAVSATTQVEAPLSPAPAPFQSNSDAINRTVPYVAPLPQPTGAPPVEAATIGRVFNMPPRPKVEEARPLLEMQAAENCELGASHMAMHANPTREFALALLGRMAIQEPPPEDEVPIGNEVEQLDDCNYAHFGPNVNLLGFRVSWDAERPFALDVLPGGEADRQGIMRNDILAEMNNVPTRGRTKEQLLPLLRERPLTIKLQRDRDCV
jgi:hypothetical protein